MRSWGGGEWSWSERDQETVAQLMSGERVANYALQIPHKDGTVQECLISAVQVEDEHGNLSGFSGSVILMTEERKKERTLHQRIHLICGPNLEQGYLATTGRLDAILTEQLMEVTKVTEQAAFDLMSRTQTIDGRLGEVMAFLDESSAMTQSQGESSRKSIDEDRQAIEGLQVFVDDAQKRRDAERKRGLAVIREISNLGKFVDTVHVISDHTNVLALNAGIIAARSGEHGHQFAVVATEVRKLSRQVKEAADEIGKGIHQSVETIESLFSENTQGNEASKREDQFLAQTADKMLIMGENYAQMLERNEASITQITTWNQNLTEMVMELLGGFQFQDITRQQIGQVIKALNRRREYTEQLQQVLTDPGMDDSALPPFTVEAMRDDYVMATQHEVHDQQIGDAPAEDAAEAVPMIELF